MMRRLQHIAFESGYIGIIKRGSAKGVREYKKLIGLARDSWSGSYTACNKYRCITSLMNHELLRTSHALGTIPMEIVSHYLSHRFDLLGSGWVQVTYGMCCRGLEQYQYNMGVAVQADCQGDWLAGRINQSNVHKAQQIWQYVDHDYRPIDWQLDFKSGYRWSEKTWSKKIKFGLVLGEVIKVPWELARMQHLPQLALTCLSNTMDSELKRRIQNEYKNQIIDFIATNPPAYGVNWVCPMDIAIRSANWLLAWDLFKSGNVTFDNNFEAILATSIYEHGLYIVNNLEWSASRGNHYLANIAGLAFIAAYLPSTTETDGWLAFAIQELLVEVDRQFYSEGSNVEGSTAYHRLSAEMVYFATALLLGLPKNRLEYLASYHHELFKSCQKAPRLQASPVPFYTLMRDGIVSPFPEQYFDRLECMAEFVMDITKPSGSIPQIGDNDSGRFFKLDPIYDCVSVEQAKEIYSNLDGYIDLENDANYFVENHLNCSHLIYAAAEMFVWEDFSLWLEEKKEASGVWNAIVLRALLGDVKISSKHTRQLGEIEDAAIEVGTAQDFNRFLLEIQQAPDHYIFQHSFSSSTVNLFKDLRLCSYPQFGLYLITSAHIYLSIRCWTGGEPEHTSHRHQDQLSVELSLDGSDIICDPGTYLYTPLPSKRNIYRNSSAHFSPFKSSSLKKEASRYVFGSISLEKVQVDYFGKKGFVAKAADLNKKNQLIVFLTDNTIEIYCANDATELCDKREEHKCLFSSGYGMKLRC